LARVKKIIVTKSAGKGNFLKALINSEGLIVSPRDTTSAAMRVERDIKKQAVSKPSALNPG